jgi:hypothetical protein
MVKKLRPEDPAAIGPYRLLGRLGAGGMGNVFLGQSPGGRLVAVKVIRPELADEPGFRVRFAREVAAARHVSGLFTALVVDADADAPVPWLATAYVAGPSLSEAVTEHGPLPVPSVLTLAAGLAEGLGVIHQAGVVHRDLKPANVLLAHDGPRVIDFGISRAMETTMLTQTGTVVGSPGFMSPEQADGKVVGPPSDVFSLGAVLAFAATGEGPFGTGPTPALMYRVVNHEPDLAGLPPQVRAVVARCLAKEPAARPATAELLAELGGSELAANWLPEPVAAALGRYAPLPAAETAERWPATVDRPPAGFPVRTPTEAAAKPDLGGGTATGRAGHGNWRRPAWLAAAAAVAVAAALTGFALSGPGPKHPVAEPSAHPAAAVKTTGAARDTRVTQKATGTASHRAKPGAKRHPARTAAGRPAPVSAAGGVPAAGPAAGPAQSGTTASSGAPQPAPRPARSSAPQPASSAAPQPTHSAPPPSTGVVPDVLGTTLSAASSALKARGFGNIPYLYNCYGSPDTGDVVQQAPGAGATISLTAPVQLYLQANNCATVPNVIGMNLSNAAYTLKQGGFTNIPYLYGCYGSSQIGAVVSESPGAGTSYGTSQPVSLKLQANNC